MKNYILQDFSAQKTLEAIEQNFIGFISDYVCTGHGDIYEEPEHTWVFTGTPLKFFNGVIRTSLASSDSDMKIKTLLNFFQSRQQVMTWWVSPLARPTDLSHRLVAHGLTLSWKEVGMTIDLHNINEIPPSSHGLVIERVQDEQTMQEWIRTNARGFAMDEHESTAYRKLVTSVPHHQHPVGPFYLARLDGEPVATSALYCAGGVAGIYQVSTVPSARQQGIGSAITMAALLDARAMGYRMGIVLAESMGVSVYRRLGFTACCTFDAYCPQSPAS
ncbi:MAG TPA: GNAT family N-acetyltransferase [Ktedonobacteraceae bacterium]|nr:GNAT family N-acetyltransferase [Ktedonobacteraceae bacterium]